MPTTFDEWAESFFGPSLLPSHRVVARAAWDAAVMATAVAAVRTDRDALARLAAAVAARAAEPTPPAGG